MASGLNVATAPKTSTFQFRINPDIKKEVEGICAQCGLTLTDAFNMFLQQTLNAQTIPFFTSTEAKNILEDQAKKLLLSELNKGMKSAEAEGWISEDEMWQEFGDSE